LFVLYLLVAQAMASQKLAIQPAPPPSQVVAENPDHARLAKRLEDADREAQTLRDERNREREEKNGERERREAAEKRVAELERSS
jgi:hypothetical protein